MRILRTTSIISNSYGQARVSRCVAPLSFCRHLFKIQYIHVHSNQRAAAAHGFVTLTKPLPVHEPIMLSVTYHDLSLALCNANKLCNLPRVWACNVARITLLCLLGQTYTQTVGNPVCVSIALLWDTCLRGYWDHVYHAQCIAHRWCCRLNWEKQRAKSSIYQFRCVIP